MTFTVEIPDELLKPLYAACAESNNWRSEIMATDKKGDPLMDKNGNHYTVPNPENIEANARRVILSHIRSLVANYLVEEARREAEEKAVKQSAPLLAKVV